MTLPAAAHTTTAAADDLVALFKASQAEHDNLRHEHAATQRRLKDAEAALHEREQTVKHQEAAAKRSSELIASLRETVQTYIGACALQAEAAEVGGGGGGAAGYGSGGGEDAARRAAEVTSASGASRRSSPRATRRLRLTRRARRGGEGPMPRSRAGGRARQGARGARRAEHGAGVHEALVTEHATRAAAVREASGKAEMDYRRRSDTLQEQIATLTKKLRTERSLKEQATARAQELAFQLAHGGATSGGGPQQQGARVGGGATQRGGAGGSSLVPPGGAGQPAMFRGSLPTNGGAATGLFASGGNLKRRAP